MRMLLTRAALAVLMALTVQVVVSSPVHAVPSPFARAAGDETITSYTIDYEVRPDGTTHVREQLSYDFGTTARHGILRTLQTREHRDDAQDRLYDITEVDASSPTAPDDVSVETEGNTTVLRVGDPNATVTGAHDYTLDYVIEGALNAFPDRGELFWDAAGPDWEVPIDNLTVTVTAPGGVTKSRCMVGPPGSTTRCGSAPVDGGRATFTQDRLEPGEVLTIVAAFSASQTEIPPPLLEPRNPVVRAFQLTPVTIGSSLVFLALGGLPLVLALRRRRDRRYAATVPGQMPAAGSTVAQELVPLSGVGEIPVQFAPPRDISPGEAGVLIRCRTAVDDMTATLIDLAVRGYVHLREVGQAWTLTVRQGPGPDLRPHETALLGTLFAGEPTVTLDSNARLMAKGADAVGTSLRRTVVDRGWFTTIRSGTSSRVGAGLLIGCFGLFFAIPFGGGILVIMAVTFRFGLPVSALVMAIGLALASLLFRAPPRTAAGHAAYIQVAGFRHYLETAEADQLRFEEGEDIFSRYLPWAIAFDLTDRWSRTCEQLAIAGRIPPSVGWYDGGNAWSYAGFSATMTSFSQTVTASTTPVSSGFSGPSSASSGSSGFSSSSSSGGGGGGGGGGSW
jgi:uncharacterized membrane protein YgcG